MAGHQYSKQAVSVARVGENIFQSNNATLLQAYLMVQACSSAGCRQVDLHVMPTGGSGMSFQNTTPGVAFPELHFARLYIVYRAGR